VLDSLEPAKGWAHFDDYVASNLKTPEEFKTKRPLSGEVELAFDVNKNGEPVNITVVKSLCNECDEEAIRLLKEGPKWKKNKKGKGKVTIRF
ncbi:MAG TPA: TonB family protein, partial [Flavisolibacter sp.]|nr:TonB family protein [Flavisolibacter sp.]